MSLLAERRRRDDRRHADLKVRVYDRKSRPGGPEGPPLRSHESPRL